MSAKPSQSKIDEILNLADDQISKGGSAYPGMSYEDGVAAAIRWVTGDSEDAPLGEN